jgi:hypothetical protein
MNPQQRDSRETDTRRSSEWGWKRLECAQQQAAKTRESYSKDMCLDLEVRGEAANSNVCFGPVGCGTEEREEERSGVTSSGSEMRRVGVVGVVASDEGMFGGERFGEGANFALVWSGLWSGRVLVTSGLW